MKIRITLIIVYFLLNTKIYGQFFNTDTLIIYDGTFLSIKESTIINNGVSDFQQGALILNGTNQQTISGTGKLIVQLLTLDNPNNFNLQTELGVKGAVQFINGIVTTNVNNTGHFIHFLDNANYMGYSANAHINGRVRKTGNAPFTFPLGGGASYDAPLSISAPSNITDQFTAYYTHTISANNINSKENILNSVSNVEHWALNRTKGFSDVAVTLSWAARSTPINQLNTVRVARWNGSQWIDSGNTATSGNTSQGTVTSNIISDFYNQFTLADYYCPTAPTLLKRN